MALLTCAGSEDGLEHSGQPEEVEEYVCLPNQENTEHEADEEEEFVRLPSHGSTQQEEYEEEEMDEEKQLLYEGSLVLFAIEITLCCAPLSACLAVCLNFSHK